MFLDKREATGIQAMVRDVIFNDVLRSDTSFGNWKILVVDEFGLSVLETTTQMNELLDHNITLIEPLEKLRTAYQTMEAVYLLRPSHHAILRIIEDFSASRNANGRLYASAHLFFISPLAESDHLLLKSSSAFGFIRTLRQVPIDYLALESRSFTLDKPYSLRTFYGTRTTDRQYESEQRQIASQIASFCRGLEVKPLIRYSTKGRGRRVCGDVASLVYQELKHVDDLDVDDDDEDQAELLIVDRTIDQVAPLLHEFTYQAMAHDILDFNKDEKFEYEYECSTGVYVKETHGLNERTDLMWADVRHLHIAEAIRGMCDRFVGFLGDYPGASSGAKLDVQQLQEVLSSVTEFRELKKQFSAHVNMSQECMQTFKARHLKAIATLEQNLATGCTAEGKSFHKIERDMEPIVTSRYVGINDKLRLLMIYLIKHGVVDDHGRQLFADAHLDQYSKDAIRNMTLLGVDPLSASKMPKQKPLSKEDDDVPFELSRYVPVLKDVMSDLVDDTLDESTFVSIKEWKMSVDSGVETMSSSSYDLISKPVWHLQNRKSKSKRKFIVFVVGGMTYSEMRSAYEVSEEKEVDLYIGSTHVTTPNKTIRDLHGLRNRLRIPGPVEIPFSPVEVEPTATDKEISAERKKKKFRRIRKFAGKLLKQIPELQEHGEKMLPNLRNLHFRSHSDS